MSDVPLAIKYSADTYDKALSNVVKRWLRKGDGESVKYDEAAIGMDESTVSTSLKFLGEIGILEVPKAGHYIVPDEVVDYRNKMGEVKREAKLRVEHRLEEYPLYEETKFILEMERDYQLDELAEEVSGSAAVAASQDELVNVKRSLNILERLGFLEIDDEGYVSIPDDLKRDSETGSHKEDAGSEADPATESEIDEETNGHGNEGTARQVPNGGTVAPPRSAKVGTIDRPDGVTRFVVDVDISMDVTEMETDEVREKLEAINNSLGCDEE